MPYKHFSIEEREKLQLMWWERQSVRTMARALNRSPSSVSRELRRNFPAEYQTYTPRLAQTRALKKRKCRGRKDRLKTDRIRVYVITHLKRRWSPEQISGRLKKDLGLAISHEAIYQYIYAQVHRDGYGYLKSGHEDLRIYLRRRRKRRLPKGARKGQRILVPHGSSIDTRPAVVTTRSRFGDWESDTVESVNHCPGINTLVERQTGLAFISKLATRTSVATSQVIIGRLKDWPAHTITFDNGAENQNWQEIESQIKTRCFFAHPYSSWERPTNENTNGLIRDYYPKRTDFGNIPAEELAAVEHQLNTRPRKRLGWLTPLEAVSVALQG